MDISNINGISTGDIKSFFNNTSLTKTDKTDSFSDVLSAAMGSIGETNDLQNAAEQEEVRFALGESDNTHDLLVAETKAAVALQYTVAVRDKIIEKAKTLGMVEAKNISGTVADEYNSEKTDSSAANSDASSQKTETEQDSQMQDSQTAQEDTQQEDTQPAADAKQETVEPQDAVTTYTISVTSQDTCRTIAEKLKALNLVDDAEQFRIYMGQKGADHFIADGEHVIPQGASYDDIITILTQK